MKNMRNKAEEKSSERNKEKHGYIAPRFQAMADASPDSIINIDKKSTIIFWNRAAKQKFGYSNAEIIGKNITMLIPKRHRFAHKRGMKKLYETNKGPLIGNTVELEALKRDGTEFPIELTLSVWDYAGVKYITGIIRDTTERKQAETALRRSEEKYRTLFSSSPVSTWEVDFSKIQMYFHTLRNKGVKDLRKYLKNHPEAVADCMTRLNVTDVNKVTLEMFEVEDLSEFKKNMGNFFGKEGLPPLGEELIALWEGKNFIESETIGITASGTKIDLITKVSVPVEHRQEWKKVLVSMIDVTASKESADLNKVLNHINQAITSTLDFNEIVRIATDEAARAIGSEGAKLFVQENSEYLLVSAFGQKELKVGVKMKRSEAPELGRTFKTKKPVVVNDVSRLPTAGRGIAQSQGVHSMMSIPLIVSDEVIGVLTFTYYSAPIGFTNAQIDFAEKIAVSLSLAIANSRSYETAKLALSDAEGLRRISADMAQSLELNEILETALEQALEALSVDQGCIYVSDGSGRLVIKTHRGLPHEFLAAKKTVSSQEGCAGQAIATKNIFAPTRNEAGFSCDDSHRLLGKDCLAAVPIVSKGRTLGVLEMFAPASRKLTKREHNMANTIADDLAATLDNAQLYSEQKNIADILQETLLTMPKKIEGLNFSHVYRSSTEIAKVGGDFYDLFVLEHDRVGILVGDVSGKGLEAATLTALVKNTVKAYAYEYGSPAKTLEKTNDVIVKTTAPNMLVTIWFGVLDTILGTLTYCGAGHPPGILRRKTGETMFLKTSSPAIGVLEDLEFVEDRALLSNEDALILYTDGVIEARQEGKLFGEDRLLRFTKDMKKTTIKKIPAYILKKTIDYASGKLVDDVAILALSLNREERRRHPR